MLNISITSPNSLSLTSSWFCGNKNTKDSLQVSFCKLPCRIPELTLTRCRESLNSVGKKSQRNSSLLLQPYRYARALTPYLTLHPPDCCYFLFSPVGYSSEIFYIASAILRDACFFIIYSCKTLFKNAHPAFLIDNTSICKLFTPDWCTLLSMIFSLRNIEISRSSVYRQMLR